MSTNKVIQIEPDTMARAEGFVSKAFPGCVTKVWIRSGFRFVAVRYPDRETVEGFGNTWGDAVEDVRKIRKESLRRKDRSQ